MIKIKIMISTIFYTDLNVQLAKNNTLFLNYCPAILCHLYSYTNKSDVWTV